MHQPFTSFTSVHDVATVIPALLEEALSVKASPLAWSELGETKHLRLFFLIPASVHDFLARKLLGIWA